MSPWDDWYHCTLHTYGTWLRGDPRGWRSRHHREHVDGDYKNPPPRGKYDALHAHSKSLMNRDPVEINHDEIIEFILRAMVDRLREFMISVAIGAFDGIHGHLLIQCRDHNPRIVVGIAKQYASARLKAHGYAVGLNLQPGEGIWAKGSHPEPITGPKHYEKTFDYIADHAKHGAAVVVPG